MKKLISAVLVLVLAFGCASAIAEEESIEAMKPILDSVLLGCMYGDVEYAPSDAHYFWSVLGLMSVNWGYRDGLEYDSGDLVVPSGVMREYAAAAFGYSGDFPAIPEEFEYWSYDQEIDAYLVPMSDRGESHTEITSYYYNDDGSIYVEAGLFYEETECGTLRATMVENASDIYPYSVTDASFDDYRDSERRMVTVVMEGEEYDVFELKYESVHGYIAWYDEDMLMAYPNESEDYFEHLFDDEGSLLMLITRAEDVNARDILSEGIANEIDGGRDMTAIEEGLTEGGLTYYVSMGSLDGDTVCLYAVQLPDGSCLCASTSYPDEVVEGIGMCFNRVIESISPTGAVG